MTRSHLLLALLLIAGLSVIRLADLGPNAAPMGAIALFCGAYLFNRQRPGSILLAIGLPLLARFVTDVALGLRHGSLTDYVFNSLMLVVYLASTAYIVCGAGVQRLWRRGSTTLPAGLRGLTYLAGALAGAVLFHLVTNLAVWALGTTYPRNLDGLIECFTLAQPFFRATLTSDLLWSCACFATFEVGVLILPRTEVAPAA